MKRGKIGNRVHVGVVKQHDGTQDASGQLTLNTSADWDIVVSQFVCELLTTSGSEFLRGQSVSSDTTHMLVGEYQNGKAITPKMQVTIEDVTYEVVSAYDPEGDYCEWWVECKRERE